LPSRLEDAKICVVESDLRAALQYVPAFRGKVFVLVINAARMPEQALAEAMLDLVALQQIGVQLLVISTGSGEAEVANRLVDGELKWEAVSFDESQERLLEILNRGQLAFMEAPGLDHLSEEVIERADLVNASKLVTFWPQEMLTELAGVHAISCEKAAAWNGQSAELLKRAAGACEFGIPRVHLLDERKQGVLLDELFSNEGVGLMIHADKYQNIRDLVVEDIPELLAMIGRSMRDAHLIPRTFENVEKALKDFLVLTVDDNVVGCVALHQYEGHRGAELACLYVKQTHESGGYGRALVEAAEAKAKQLEVPWVFALTTRAFEYFVARLGYEKGSVGDLPREREALLLASGRESSVVKKSLS